MNDQIQQLRHELVKLHQENEELGVELSSIYGVVITLIRYLAQGNQVYMKELCDDLDVLCKVRNEPVWQRSIIALTETLRSVDERLK